MWMFPRSTAGWHVPDEIAPATSTMARGTVVLRASTLSSVGVVTASNPRMDLAGMAPTEIGVVAKTRQKGAPGQSRSRPPPARTRHAGSQIRI